MPAWLAVAFHAAKIVLFLAPTSLTAIADATQSEWIALSVHIEHEVVWVFLLAFALARVAYFYPFLCPPDTIMPITVRSVISILLL